MTFKPLLFKHLFFSLLLHAIHKNYILIIFYILIHGYSTYCRSYHCLFCIFQFYNQIMLQTIDVWSVKIIAVSPYILVIFSIEHKQHITFWLLYDLKQFVTLSNVQQILLKTFIHIKGGLLRNPLFLLMPERWTAVC